AMGGLPYWEIVWSDGFARALAERSARLGVDGRRPDRSVFFGHAAVRREARVLVSPELEIHEVLGARGQGPAADLPRGGMAHLVLQEPHALAHHGFGNAPALGGVDEAEERQVREQDAPVLAEALAQSVPVERPGAGVQEVGDIGAVVSLALHHERLRPDHL